MLHLLRIRTPRSGMDMAAELGSSTTNVDGHHNGANADPNTRCPSSNACPTWRAVCRPSAFVISPSSPFGILRKAMAACAAASFATPSDFHDYHCRFFPFLHWHCAKYSLSAKRRMRRMRRRGFVLVRRAACSSATPTGRERAAPRRRALDGNAPWGGATGMMMMMN